MIWKSVWGNFVLFWGEVDLKLILHQVFLYTRTYFRHYCVRFINCLSLCQYINVLITIPLKYILKSYNTWSYPTDFQIGFSLWILFLQINFWNNQFSSKKKSIRFLLELHLIYRFIWWKTETFIMNITGFCSYFVLNYFWTKILI